MTYNTEALLRRLDAFMEGYDWVGTGNSEDAREQRLEWASLRSDIVAALTRPSSPAASDGDEYFLTAHVSADGRIIGIAHPNDADFDAVLTAHVALRDRINERIAAQSRCPFYPKGRPPAATDGDVVEKARHALMPFASLYVRQDYADGEPKWPGTGIPIKVGDVRRAREAYKALSALPPSPVSDGGAVRSCTCHPNDRPAGECRQKFAASECQRAADNITERG